MRDDVLKLIEQTKDAFNNKNSLFLDKYIGYYNADVDDHVVLYESFNGAGMIDNPYGIFKAFQQRDDFYEYQHVWVINNYNLNWRSIIEYSKFTNVIFIAYGSDDYLYYLSTAKYLINNCTFPTYFTKKPNQIYINTWHGLTNKHLGYDVPNSNMAVGNTIRNFLSCDYIVSVNPFMTEIYLNAYKLRGLWNGKFIEVGQPRNDLTWNANKDYVINKLSDYGVKIDPNKKIVLYAPTWQGTLNKPKYIDFDKIKNALSVQGYQVLIKPHHVNYEKKPQYIPMCIDTNELISICDVLVTDYSSIYYDWLMKDKPVLFYAPDYAEYKKKQGLYNDFPYAYAKDLKMLRLMMEHIDSFYQANGDILIRENIKHNKYMYNAGGNVLSVILDGSQRHVITMCNNKIKLLFYAGDFKSNGVTTSFSSLLHNIDYNKYDVSVIVLKKDDNEYAQYVNSIDSRARVLCRSGTYSQTLMESCANAIVMTFGIGTNYLRKLLPRALYKREFTRCFGNVTFDKLINFTGYSPFYGYFFMCNNGEKIIWQHNDMLQDQNRIENGLKPLEKTLSVVFTTYPYYDRLVSASKCIMDVNITEFPEIDKNKFAYAHNTLNYDNIVELSHVNNGISVDKTKINFVTTGRLSYAKNHINLIKAFHRFHDKYHMCELYIIGDGNLKEELMREINNVSYIHLPGYSDNPFNTMAKCDCFIFPSLYEGQGIALLEARVLGLPIIVTPLPKMNGIFINDGQYVLDGFTENDIYNGLMDFISNTKTYDYMFDYFTYNKSSYLEFERAIDG